MDSGQSGSAGEGDLQERFGTKRRALSFYENSMHDRLNEVMQRFVAERIMFFSERPTPRGTRTVRRASARAGSSPCSTTPA